MTRTDQRQVLEAFSRDYTRELHNFMAADLCAQPQLASIFRAPRQLEVRPFG